MHSLSDFTFTNPPKPVGYFIMLDAPGQRVIYQMPYKPKWLHRVSMLFFFGWRWVDTPHK